MPNSVPSFHLRIPLWDNSSLNIALEQSRVPHARFLEEELAVSLGSGQPLRDPESPDSLLRRAGERCRLLSSGCCPSPTAFYFIGYYLVCELVYKRGEGHKVEVRSLSMCVFVYISLSVCVCISLNPCTCIVCACIVCVRVVCVCISFDACVCIVCICVSLSVCVFVYALLCVYGMCV